MSENIRRVFLLCFFKKDTLNQRWLGSHLYVFSCYTNWQVTFLEFSFLFDGLLKKCGIKKTKCKWNKSQIAWKICIIFTQCFDSLLANTFKLKPEMMKKTSNRTLCLSFAHRMTNCTISFRRNSHHHKNGTALNHSFKGGLISEAIHISAVSSITVRAPL